MSSKKPFIIGLTGSMGMGKTTTAKMFQKMGIPVWDADAAVHRLYAKGGDAVEPLRKLHGAAIRGGAVDRNALKTWIAADENALKKIEAVVHPLLVRDKESFLATADSDIVVFDIPLLFESGGEKDVDLVVVVSVPKEIQLERLLARKTMDQATLETMLAAQMPDSEKRARADYVIETRNFEAARRAVRNLLDTIRESHLHA